MTETSVGNTCLTSPNIIILLLHIEQLTPSPPPALYSSTCRLYDDDRSSWNSETWNDDEGHSVWFTRFHAYDHQETDDDDDTRTDHEDDHFWTLISSRHRLFDRHPPPLALSHILSLSSLWWWSSRGAHISSSAHEWLVLCKRRPFDPQQLPCLCLVSPDCHLRL